MVAQVVKLKMARSMLISLCMVLLVAQSAWADVYKYVDSSGTVTLTDVKTPTTEPGHVLARIYRVSTAPSYTPPDKYTYPDSHLRISPARSERYRDMIDDHASEHGLDPRLLEAVITAESNFNQTAISNKGALGLMQLMPDTASLMGVRNPFNADENISGGARYLHAMLDRFGGNLTLALAAYNAGPQNVEKYGTVPPFAETQNYIRRIYSLYKGEKRLKGYSSEASFKPATIVTQSAVVSASVTPPPKAKKEPIYKMVLADGTILYTNNAYAGRAGNAAR